MQSMLADYIRLDNHVGTQSDDADMDWLSWIRHETHRRASLIAFAYLNVQSTTYDLPPVIMSSEVKDLFLPCGSTAWEAKDVQELTDACDRSYHKPVRVVDAMSHFLSQADPKDGDRSLRSFSIGSFVILQALIQRASLVRQLETRQDAELPQNELMIMQ
nr:hypothetical protein CFP56_33429 [Quercus suber]